MKYTSEITINLPLEDVIHKMDSAENMKHWQKGFISYDSLSENPKSEGAQMRLVYKMGKRDMVLTETIVKYNFPHEFHANYDAKGVHNIQKNYFEAIDANTTKWVSENEFQFSGFMMKAMGFLMPSAFKKQSMVYLTDFKNFAEKRTSLLDNS